MRILIIALSIFIVLSCKNNQSVKVLKSEIDTIKINGHILTFDSINIKNYPDIDLTNQLQLTGKETIDDSLNVQRIDNKLRLKLKSGDTIILLNNPGDPNIDNGPDTSFIHYEYRKKINDDFWAVFVNGDIWSEIQLINSKNGEKIVMVGMPSFSPNKDFIISGSGDEREGNYLELYSVNGSKIKQIFSRRIENWWPEKLFWINNDSVIIQRGYLDGKFNYVKMNIH